MNIARGSMGLGVVAFGAFFAVAAGASAQTQSQSPPAPPVVDTSAEEPMTATIWPLAPVFDRSPGWGIGLDAYAGLAVVSTRDGGFSHGFVGGLSRFRLSYFQLGAFIESSDGGDNQWRSIGGFVGAFIPYRHWVDFDFGAGLAARTYRDESARYGPDGFESTMPALTLRAAVSDRTVDDLFGIRLGGQLTAAFDLDRDERPWVYEFETSEGDVRTVTGESAVGGFSIGIAVTAGFDVGRKPYVAPEPRTYRASR